MNVKKIRGIVVAMIAVLLALIGTSKAKDFFLAKDAVASEGEVKEALTVNFDEILLGKAYPEISREFLDSSMPNRNRERVEAAGFSTALTMPFSGVQQDDGVTYPDETIERWWSQELREEILRNPVHGMAVMRSLAELKFSDGSTLADLNPWLKEAIIKYDNFFTEGEGKVGTSGFLEVKSEGSSIQVTEEYRHYAVGTCWLLDRFTDCKVQRTYSERHWGLKPANDLTPSQIRAEVFEGAEDRDALIVSLTSKSGKVFFTIGFNVHDKRPEIPGEKKPPETTTRPPETTRPRKERREDPVNNGGAQRGGGSATAGTDTFEPKDPATETGQGHGDPVQVTQPAPTTAASHKDVPVDNHNETRMDQATKPASTDSGRRDDNGQADVIGNDDNAQNQNNGFWQPED